jgi:hypothetical protein
MNEMYFGNNFLTYSQTCVQQPPLGPEKRGRYAERSVVSRLQAGR